MKVMILAAGRGQRMGDLTAQRPKPLLTVGGLPIIVHLIKQLRQRGLPTPIYVLSSNKDEDLQREGDSEVDRQQRDDQQHVDPGDHPPRVPKEGRGGDEVAQHDFLIQAGELGYAGGIADGGVPGKTGAG